MFGVIVRLFGRIQGFHHPPALVDGLEKIALGGYYANVAVVRQARTAK